MTEFSIASFNAFAGGNRGEYDQRILEPKDLSGLKSIISKLSLSHDIVTVSDTFGWSEIFGESGLVEEFGFPNCKVVDLDDERLKNLYGNGLQIGVAVLSFLEFEDIQVLNLAGRNALQTKVKGKKSENNVNINAVYLDDLRDPRKLQAIELAKKMNQRKEAHIVCGDLNNENPSKMQKRMLGNLCMAASKIAPSGIGGVLEQIHEMQSGEVIKILEEAELKDAGDNQLPTVPTQFKGKAIPPFLAIDRFLHTPDILTSHTEVLDSNIIRNVLDHLPVRLDVQHILEAK